MTRASKGSSSAGSDADQSDATPSKKVCTLACRAVLVGMLRETKRRE
jgi:hypothetical protein